jgi:uncharacterized protein YndB with AHSA1/START domain
MNTSTDRIETRVLINGTRARVWRAISNAAELGEWFGVDFKGKAFAAGKPIQGKITYPGFEHLTMEVDYSQEPTTLVEFEIEEVEGGTMVSVVESGLDKIPLERRATVFRLNSSGWDEQMENIKKYVAKA